MRLLKSVLCLTVISASAASAQSEKAGVRAFDFLKLDNNARTISMGGASVAVPNGLYGASVNPAACGFIDKTQAMLGYESLVLDAWAGPMGYATPYRGYGVLASTILYISHGYLDGSEALDESGKSTGVSWHVFSLAGSLAWSKIVYTNFSVGLAIKGIHHTIGSSQQYHASAQGIALDGGFQYRMMNSRLIVGGALQNAGFIVSNYTKESDKRSLSFSATIGISYVPLHIPNLRFACDLQKANDDYLNYKPGVEFAVYEKILFLRGGFGFSEQDLEEVFKKLKNESPGGYIKSNSSGLSLGAGLVTKVKGIPTNADIACMTRVDGMPPSFMLTFLFEY